MKKGKTSGLPPMTVVLKNGEFKIRQNLQPLGKLVHAKVASATTVESYNQVFQSEIADKHRFEMLQSKLLETIADPDQHARYQDEMDKLVRKTTGKKQPNFGKLKNVTMRVIAYDKNGATIVEPAFKADENLLVKIGYSIKSDQ